MMKTVACALAFAFAVACIAPAQAQQQKSASEAALDAEAALLAEKIAKAEEVRATQKFGGVEFGIGISFTLDVGNTDRVAEAEVVDGIVRVKDVDNGRARIMLEMHHFFTPHGTLFLGRENRIRDRNGKLPIEQQEKEWGFGPFVAIQPGTDDIIEAVAAGVMIGLRHDPKSTQSFNFGVGWVVDPNTRTLGDGIVANQPLPGNETGIRYKERMQNGVLVLASFGF